KIIHNNKHILNVIIEIDRFVLTRPEIALEVDRTGRPNWLLGPAQPAAPDARPAEAKPAEPGGRTLPDHALGTGDLVKGQVSYSDARNGASYTLDGVDATLRLPTLDGPARLTGAFTYRDRRVSADAEAASARRLIEGQETPLKLSLGGDLATVKFDGTATLPGNGNGGGNGGGDGAGGGGAHAKGTLSAAVPALGDLLAWVLPHPPASVPVRSLGLTGLFDAVPSRVAFQPATLTVDDVTARGPLAVQFGGPRPKLSGDLAVSRINLDRYMGEARPPSRPGAAPASPQEQAAPQPSGRKAGQEPAPAPAPATAPAPAGTAAGGGGSDAPFDLKPLRKADLDLKLALDGMTARGVDIGASKVALSLADGKLDATVGETALFDGTVSARVGADARSEPPSVALDLRANQVQAEPVLSRFAHFDRLTGIARAAISVHGTGASRQALMSSLDGQGTATFNNGAIKGVNLGALVQSVTGAAPGAAQGEGQQTAFAELASSFHVNRGVATTDDLHLQAPLLRLTGKGRVDLGQRTVDMRLEPRLAATLQGQGGKSNVAGIGVPILVGGTFDQLTFTPDLASIADEALRDPDKLRREAQGIRDALRSGGKPEDKLRGAIEGLV
ncbi:MAG: AsmA-like C-terminal region-containing protein, partial [Catenulispora sp.]